MNIRFLETLICLADTNSFKLTAERLNMTPAAISSRVAVMEDELGFKIFTRDKDVRVTPEGDHFIAGSRKILFEFNQLVQETTTQDLIKGVVRIGIVPAISSTFLAGIIARITENYPGIRFSILTEASPDVLKRLRSREIDVALCIEEKPEEGVIARTLCNFGFFWVASPSLLKGVTKAEYSPADIARYPLISPGMTTHNHRMMLDFLRSDGRQSDAPHFSNALGTTISMLEAGLGVSVLPAVAIQNELRQGSLQVLKTAPAFPSTRYSAVYFDDPTTRLPSLIAEVAQRVAMDFCAMYDRSLAFAPDLS